MLVDLLGRLGIVAGLILDRAKEDYEDGVGGLGGCTDPCRLKLLGEDSDDALVQLGDAP